MNSPPAGKPQRAEGFTVGSRPCAFLKPSVRLARRKDFSERILEQKIGNDLRCRLLLRLSDGNHWRSLGDSNPCFRRERATSWAARRREQARSLANSADHRPAQGEAEAASTRWDSGKSRAKVWVPAIAGTNARTRRRRFANPA